MGNVVSGIVLCGGLGTRMGQDKAWLPWGSQPLLNHMVKCLQPFGKDLFVVGRPAQDLPLTDACVVRDRIPGCGPLGGLEAGLTTMATPYGIVVACDMPWVSQSLLEAMVRCASGWDLVIPRVAGRYQPLHAVYAKSLQPVVARLLLNGERRMHALVGVSKTRVVEESFLRTYDPSRRSLKGIDTWEVYEGAVRGSV
jgi:molybdopterin-guanine dinucleotide biosynthesis protein A